LRALATFIVMKCFLVQDIHPESKWNKIPEKLKKILYKEMLKVLKKGIDFGGDSMSDYRNINGERGEFQNKHNAYRKTGSKCSKPKCSGTITRTVITGRSSHYCTVHQQLYK
jgi:formamidopyrimidine-DNA glycosylase